MKLSIILLAAFAVSVYSTQPGLVIRLTQAGADYAKTVGLQILQDKVHGVTIPNQSGSESILSYDLTNIQIDSFSVPTASSAVVLNSGNMEWKSNNIAAHIRADYHISVGSGWFSISKSGWLEASTNTASFDAVTSFGETSGEPTIHCNSVSASVGSLSITFHGDVVDSILNLFQSEISGYVGPALKGVLQDQISSLINSQANDALKGIPLSVDVIDGVSIDYSLTANPVFAPGYAQLSMKGEVFKGSETQPSTPAAPAALTATDRMVYIEGTDYILDTMGYAFQQTGMLTYHLTKDELDTLGGAGKYLATTCSDGQCVGAIIPQIGQKYPNMYVEVDMASSAPATATITTDGVMGSLVGTLDFKVRQADNTLVEAFTATVTLSVIAVDVAIKDYVISGQTHTTGATLAVKSSVVGTVDQAGLEQVWQLTCLGVIDGLLNSAAEKGIQIPNIPYITLQNPSISFAANTLIVGSDIQYTG